MKALATLRDELSVPSINALLKTAGEQPTWAVDDWRKHAREVGAVRLSGYPRVGRASVREICVWAGMPFEYPMQRKRPLPPIPQEASIELSAIHAALTTIKAAIEVQQALLSSLYRQRRELNAKLDKLSTRTRRPKH